MAACWRSAGDRPGRAVYWVLPGGHVDRGDRSLEAALSREIGEIGEIGVPAPLPPSTQ
jgi:8-oxo-dGTP pyrophosphatase MutT (NUDIX family)